MLDALAEAALAALLEDRYRSGPITLRAIGELNPVYQVERGDGAPWVVRVGRNVPRYAACLRYLAAHAYPAPRLVPAVDGSPVTVLGDQPVMVTTMLEGRHPPLKPGAMELVGAALGRLHTLPLTGAALEPPIQRAGMQPRGEIAHARSWLDSVRDIVPASERAYFDELDRACQSIDYCEGLAPSFIHGDAHYNNTILTPDGALIYLDFDSAGPGPAVVDLGFLLVNAHAAPIVAPPRAPDALRVAAVIRGYCRYRVPPGAERERLRDAIRFRPLMWACSRFAAAVKRNETPPKWLLQRVRMSDELAELALDALRAVDRSSDV